MDQSQGPDVLQLLKWGPTDFQYKLSDYREAFISPTREQLLLLSYQYEALLLPLVTGDFPSQNVSQGRQSQSSETSSSASLRKSNTLGSKDGSPCRSAAAADFDFGSSSVQEIRRSSNYSFISGVNSLAWGLCGDSYNNRTDTSFRELLFVSSGHQVVVHAFRQTDRRIDNKMSALGDQFGKGRWVKWGPSSVSLQNLEPDESFSPSSEITDANEVHENGDGVKGLQNESVTKELSGGVVSKKWFCSFSTKAETVESDGKFWTQFPGKASFPSSAEVVSFSLFDNDSPLRNFLTQGSLSGSVVSKSDGLSDSVVDSCKCSRVFSNCSYSLVGFVLSLVDSVFIDPEDDHDTKKTRTQVLLVVARLHYEGIQWVSSVKLRDSFDAEPLAEWVDFCFSDNLLICLSTHGLVYFYAAFSGEFVAHIDILQASGLNRQPSMLGQDRVQLAGGRRMFKKLLVASHTTLIAAVDDYGIIYVICVGKHLPDQYNPMDRLLPCFRNSELGIFVGWEVGSKHIGCQRVYLTGDSGEGGKPPYFSGSKYFLPRVQQLNPSARGMVEDPGYHGSDAASNTCLSVGDARENSHLIREVLLPTERFEEDDNICFSALGITRFLRRHSLDSQRTNQVLHLSLRKHAKSCDDESLNSRTKLSYLDKKAEAFLGETVGCSFQGSLYLVTEVGISVVLPSISVSPNYLPVETLGYRQHKVKSDCKWNVHGTLCDDGPTLSFLPWKIEILDRIILLEGPEVADRLCLQNGWDMKTSRLRRLQLALDYLKFDEIQLSLEMLIEVNLVEEGILRVLFAAVYLISLGNRNDIEVSAASRLLVLATSFTTKIIRNDGLLEHKGRVYTSESSKMTRLLSLPSVQPEDVNNGMESSQRLYNMGRFLEIVRNLQYRLGTMSKQTGQGSVDGRDALTLAEVNTYPDQPQLALVLPNAASLETSNHHELQICEHAASSGSDKLALVPADSVDDRFDAEGSNTTSMVVSGVRNKVLPLENPMEMIARWKLDNLDLKTVVKDALHSGRLPLAVLQLHLHRSKEMSSDNEPPDTFGEVREIGRAIAYDLFLKGETRLAIATLQRLGEDVENCLKQLLFGTVRRSLRVQVAEEMRRYSYLAAYEWKILEKISLIERLYPSSSFWRTFLGRQNASTNEPDSPIRLYLLNSLPYSEAVVECGEIDGVVLGSWTTISENTSDPEAGEDEGQVGYWAAAVVWSGAWDQRTIDRIVLDQPFLMGVHVLWESQLEYYASHNDWDEVSKLVDIIPSSVLTNGSLQIALDSSQQTPAIGYGSEFSDYGNYICSIEELDAVCLDIPGIKIFRFPVSAMCSTWLRRLIEQELAKKYIFLKEYWEGTAEIVGLLARIGFISRSKIMLMDEDNDEGLTDLNVSVGRPSIGTMQGLHKLVIHHCVQYNLTNLLDLYINLHQMDLDNKSLSSLVDAAGDCQWAKWLILSRIKGCEYDSSFCNARTVLSRNMSSDGNPMEINDIIRTVDDIAEGGGEMAALATLMYSPIPIQNCLCSGSVIRHGSSAQCTMENLRPTLQLFPTLQRALVTSSFEQDKTSNFLGLNANNVLSSYLKWRDNVFFSSGRDTSLLQMLPCWFPKSVRRLIQLYIQGPLGWQSLLGMPPGDSLYHRDIDFYILEEEHTEISPVAWEATVQKHVQEELYGSLLEETGLGLEHHLLRGRALAAFNHVLGVRLQKLKKEGESGESPHGQNNVQSDVQMLLAPLLPSEEALLSSVIPLAITHFEDSVLVASCTFLLELCGLSASMIRVDVACLSRISSFYKLRQNNESYGQMSPKVAFHPVSYEDNKVESLARSLADEYVNRDYVRADKLKQSSKSVTGKRPSRALMLVLHHLEKASLPTITDAKTCGSWLLTGNGDGAELRYQQKAASQHWNLVTVFCQMHQLPLSMKYLAFLARDNDWVGFLSEAQIGGYPFDTVLQVASKEFSDARLKIHITTVLKSMQSKKKISSPSSSDTAERSLPCSDDNVLIPVELFSVIADCEKQSSPGIALLQKAKEMSWATLAMVASCFSEVSPLTCLTIWLEITAARETSSIKVNNVTSQIADNVLAAVEATNSFPTGTASPTCHYNRQNPKRRRLMEPISENVSSVSNSAEKSISDDAIAEESKAEFGESHPVSGDSDEGPVSLSKMVAVLCEQKLFLPLLRAFEMFLPSCSLLPFLRAIQAFSQMRLSEASAHLGSFSARIRDEASSSQTNAGREASVGVQWISSTAVRAADAMLSTCPSAYEKRCLLQLLAATEFGDGGSAATYYRQLYWKINLAEPSLRKDDDVNLGNESLDDASLLEALEKNGYWEQARNWARQLGASGGTWKSAVHHVTETQAESMVAEWKEFLWDVPEERVALWGHCQTLFIRYSFPPLQAGLFFLKHAEAVEKDLPAKELHELLLLSLQWLSGMITLSNPVYPLHLLREIETRVWLLAVESEAEIKCDGDFVSTASSRDPVAGHPSNMIDKTANLVAKMDRHINAMKSKSEEIQESRENNMVHHKNQAVDASTSASGGNMKTKRRTKGHFQPKKPYADPMDKVGSDTDDIFASHAFKTDLQFLDESAKLEVSFSKWEERIETAEMERAVLSLLEFGQITAAKQLQHKLSPSDTPSEFLLVDAALTIATLSTPWSKVSVSMIDEDVQAVLQSYNICTEESFIDPLEVLESLVAIFTESRGRGLCKRIIAVVKAANVLGLSFSEAFDKQPVELLQLLSLKAQESFEEALLLVQTHTLAASSIAQILAESFLKGLLAAHRGGYMDTQKDEGPAPLLWRFSDFLKWAQLCPSEPEIGHALMRLVITGQEIPHACEVELLILSHHFYKSSACLDGVDVLVALAATRVEAYVSEGDYSCLARLLTGVGNFQALYFVLGILIENGQLDLLLQKFTAAADSDTETAVTVEGFRMAVLTALKHFNPQDLDAFDMVYNHFNMKHEIGALLESRAQACSDQWFRRYYKDQNEELLEAMRYFIEAAEVYFSMDAGNKTRRACSEASLVSLQIRMPDTRWLNLSETNARRVLVEQSQFQEALIVAEAYGLNQPGEWVLVLWNQMLKPELTEAFVAEFVAVLPLQPSTLIELARFYRAEVAARGDQSQFSVWLTGGGMPAEWAKYLGRSFRCLLKVTWDMRLRLQLANIATGFADVVTSCMKALDKVPDNGGPLVLRKGHGGGYLPLM
ncbi:Protein DDB_G0268328 [Linum perenne]